MRPYRVPSPPSPPNGVPCELVYTPPAAPRSIASMCRSLGRRMVGRGARAASGSHRLVLRIDSGELCVVAGDQALLVVGLRDLLDVELDTRSIEKLQGQVRPDGVIGTGPPVALDVARLVLVVSSRDAGIPLSEGYASYGESLEWMGKVRHFLRRHGWVPQDERER